MGAPKAAATPAAAPADTKSLLSLENSKHSTMNYADDSIFNYYFGLHRSS